MLAYKFVISSLVCKRILYFSSVTFFSIQNQYWKKIIFNSNCKLLTWIKQTVSLALLQGNVPDTASKALGSADF